MAAHAAPCQAVGVSFIPLVVEILGGWSERFADILSSIGCLLDQHLGMPPSETTHHLFHFSLERKCNSLDLLTSLSSHNRWYSIIMAICNINFIASS